MSHLGATLLAGLSSAIASLVVFLVVHHLWIKPIWEIALPGLAIASLGGLAIGWAYFLIAAALPERPWAWLAMFGIIFATLLPGILLSFTHGPLFDLATAKIRPGEGRIVAIRFFIELVVPAVVVGTGLGYWLGGRSAAGAMALAALALSIGPGHNVPMFGASPPAAKGIAVLTIVIVPVAVVLVEATAWLSRR